MTTQLIAKPCPGFVGLFPRDHIYRVETDEGPVLWGSITELSTKISDTEILPSNSHDYCPTCFLALVSSFSQQHDGFVTLNKLKEIRGLFERSEAYQEFSFDELREVVSAALGIQYESNEE